MDGIDGDPTVGIIEVFRSAGGRDRDGSHDVLIDGEPAGVLETTAPARFAVSPGQHTVKLKVLWTGSPQRTVWVPPGGKVVLKARSPGAWRGGWDLLRSVAGEDQWLELDEVPGNPTLETPSALPALVMADLRRIHSPDVQDLSVWQPAGDFAILVQLMVGPADSPGEESFDVTVCTPGWLADRVRQTELLSGRHHLIVESWNFDAVSRYYRRRVAECVGPTWDEVAEKVGRLGHWEFEDYQPSAPPVSAD